jgi:hypothetical protein
LNVNDPVRTAAIVPQAIATTMNGNANTISGNSQGAQGSISNIWRSSEKSCAENFKHPAKSVHLTTHDKPPNALQSRISDALE